MRDYTLQIVLMLIVSVNRLDCSEFRYWFEIPENISGYINCLKEKVKFSIVEIKTEIWELMLCALSDRRESINNDVLNFIGRADDNIYSATVDVRIESMAHIGGFRKELLPENSDFKCWSPKLHDTIESVTTELSADIVNALVSIAESYYSNNEGGGDPRYGIHRNDKTNQTGS